MRGSKSKFISCGESFRSFAQCFKISENLINIRSAVQRFKIVLFSRLVCSRVTFFHAGMITCMSNGSNGGLNNAIVLHYIDKHMPSFAFFLWNCQNPLSNETMKSEYSLLAMFKSAIQPSLFHVLIFAWKKFGRE